MRGGNHVDHGANDVARSIELTRVSRDLCHVSEQPFINLRKDYYVCTVTEVQAINLRDDACETSAATLVILDSRKNAAQTNGNSVAVQVLKVWKELPIYES
jgi:hypothetical protein